MHEYVFSLTLTITGNCRVIDSFRTRGVAENIPTCKEIILVPDCVDVVENSLMYIDGILITATVINLPHIQYSTQNVSFRKVVERDE